MDEPVEDRELPGPGVRRLPMQLGYSGCVALVVSPRGWEPRLGLSATGTMSARAGPAASRRSGAWSARGVPVGSQAFIWAETDSMAVMNSSTIS